MANAHLRDTKQDPKNARRHNPRNVGMVESSIQHEGFGRSILLANDGTIIAGNATAEAAASAGIEDMIVIDSDGTKVIAVRRTDVEPGSDRFHKLAISDNRAADLAEWDASVLQSLADDIDLTPFFRDDELDALLVSLGEIPDFDPNAEWQGMPEFHQDDQTGEFRAIVNFNSVEDLEAFERLVEQSIPRNTKSIWYPAQARQTARKFAYVDDADAA